MREMFFPALEEAYVDLKYNWGGAGVGIIQNWQTPVCLQPLAEAAS